MRVKVFPVCQLFVILSITLCSWEDFARCHTGIVCILISFWVTTVTKVPALIPSYTDIVQSRLNLNLNMWLRMRASVSILWGMIMASALSDAPFSLSLSLFLSPSSVLEGQTLNNCPTLLKSNSNLAQQQQGGHSLEI